MKSSADEDLGALLDAYIASVLAQDPPEDLEPWQYTEQQLLDELARCQQRVDASRARQLALLAEAEKREACQRRASLPTAGWLVDRNTHSPRAARQDVRLAVGLQQTPIVAAALSQSRISCEQAAAIINGLHRLPDDLDAGLRDQVTTELVGYANSFGPAALARLVNRAVEVVAPAIAEEADRKAVERLDAEQRRNRHLTWHQDSDGSWIIRGKFTAVAGEQLITVLRAVSAKHRSTVLLAGGQIERSQANADALTMLVDHYQSCGTAPAFGADRPRITITIDYDTLIGKLGTAVLLGSAEQLTAHEARRLACDADILPTVLNTNSVPLDVGRTKRLFTDELRQAIILRDQGCMFPGCDRPPAECEVHHRKPWWAGGETSLANGVLVCRYHHHLAEPDPNKPTEHQWLIRLDDRGLPEFAAPLRPGQTERVWKQHHRHQF